MTELSDEVNGLTEVCAAVVDADGIIIAINDEARELFGLPPGPVGTRNWTDVLPEDRRDDAQTSITTAVGGQKTGFALTTPQGEWEVACLPLPCATTERPRVLVLSHKRGNELHTSVRSVMHVMTNIISASSSAARVVRRGVDGSRAEAIAGELEATAQHAVRAIEDLRTLLGLTKKGNRT